MQKIFKKFYANKTSRKVGTLANLKAVLHRTNVNGTVKSTGGYEPHKDFAAVVTR